MDKCFYEKLNSQKCPIDKKFSELKALEKCELFVEWTKQNWLRKTIKLIFYSLIILFFIGIVSELFEVKFDILKNLNTWVGFMLGIVATIFSIISMFLSFYNIEKSKESEEKQREISDKILEEIKQALTKTNEIIANQEEEIKQTINLRFKILENKIDVVSENIKYSSENSINDQVNKF